MVSKDGTEIWSESKRMQYQPQNNSEGVLGMLISAAVARAVPNYMPLAQQANQQVFVLGPNAIPDGPYRITSTK